MKKIVLAIALLCFGCGPKEGHVVSREFVPAHDDSYVTYNDYGSAEHPCIIPQFHTDHVPDKWFITVTLDGTNFGTWECSQWDYDNATNGAWFRKGFGIVQEPSVEKGIQ